MNKQEAINILAGLYRISVENGADKFASEINKAIDMAIEALSAKAYKPSGMWINTQENQLKIGGYSGYCSVCHEWSEYLTDYCGKCGAYMVKELEGELVTERETTKMSSICDHCATVGCIFQAGIEREKCAFYKNKADKEIDEQTVWGDCSIEAWQPIPEPYKGGDTE